jgi:predicted metalloprotease with PDZ domain
MRYPLLFLVALLQGPLLFAQNLKYTIQIEPRDVREMRVSVDMECYHSDRDTIYIGIPLQISQVTDIHKHYRNWSVTGGRIVIRDSNYIAIKVTNKKSPLLTVHYDIFSPAANGTVTRTNAPAPLLQPDYLHIRGYSLLLCPLHYRTFDVEVNWKTLPKGWKIQNSFGYGSKQQRFRFNNRDDWRRTNWVAGDFRYYKAEVYGKPVCFAVRGKWHFEDTTLFNAILKTVKTQREQWNDRDIDFYSVSLIPYKVPTNASEWDKGSLCMGNGLYQSFVTYADEECLLADFVDLFNHEMMHEWIGGRIDDGEPTEEICLRWFVEGFTEYFALRNRWKAGFMTEQAFFEELNKEYFTKHYQSPHAELPNLVAEQRRWEAFELERIPYRRGCIAALYLDAAIRQRSGNKKTLFGMMNDLMEYTYGTGRNLTDSYDFLVETLEDYYGKDASQWLGKHIDQGRKLRASDFILPNYLLVKDNEGIPQVSLNPAQKDAARLFLKD